MLTKKINECIEKAIEDINVQKAIRIREKHKTTTIKSIHAVIKNRKNTRKSFAMIIRVGFNFIRKIEDDSREDILVDVIYHKNKTTGSESFDVKKYYTLPELPNLNE